MTTPVRGANGTPPTATEIEEWIRGRLVDLLGDSSIISVHKPIAAYGVDSVEVAQLVSGLEDWLEKEIPTDLIWEWASTREITQRLLDFLDQEAAG